MKRSFAHLPEHKRKELKLIRHIIRQMVDPEMVILFGSYARGDWIEESTIEDNVIYQYMSDFDVLVVVESKDVARRQSLWQRLENRLDRDPDIRTEVNVIHYDIERVNKEIAQGHYLFTEIKQDGILLYDSKRYKLARRRKLDPEERKQLAERDFKEWFKSAREFYKHFEFAFKRAKYKIAAFQLHQAVERYYTTAILVFTRYRPRVHNIEMLGKQAAAFEPAFVNIFPRATEEEVRLFKLLKNAYIDARYKPSYKISKKELEYLAGRVRELERVTRRVCKKRIESFGQEAEQGRSR